jgi:glutamyl-tRNA synthetase
MTVRVRIAPSPTGKLHIGTARTAVFNWLFARHHRGKFILRIEDTDLERSRPEYTENILEGLQWLGLDWDEGPLYQSQRLDLYAQVVQTLLDKGLAYRCYTTPEELDQLREQQKANKQAPRYDNRHRNLSAKQRRTYEAQGRQAVIRFIIDDDRTISWQDMVRGTVTWKGRDLGGDMVIARTAGVNSIGQPLYNMAVVVDDIDMNITHVIRGEDHIGNTPKQILLYEALSAPVPEFAHTPLILNTAGQKLSKRDGVTSISDFRDMGLTSEALANYMTLLGWTPPDSTQELFTLSDAAKVFTFERVNKAGAKFDWDKLNWINSQYLHKTPVSDLTDSLIPYWQNAGYDFDAVNDRPWLEQITTLIAPSLVRLQDGVEMCKLFFVENLEYEEQVITLFQQQGPGEAITAVLKELKSHQTLTSQQAQEITKKVGKIKGLNKGIVMRSLRGALTGAMHGPDLVESWVILHQRGLDIARLENALKLNSSEDAQTTLTAESSKTEPPVKVVETAKEEPSPTDAIVSNPKTPNPVEAGSPGSLSSTDHLAQPAPAMKVVETPKEKPSPTEVVTETPVKVVETPKEKPSPTEAVTETPVKVVETPKEKPSPTEAATETPVKVVETPSEEPSPTEVVAQTPVKVVETPSEEPSPTDAIASPEPPQTKTPKTPHLVGELSKTDNLAQGASNPDTKPVESQTTVFIETPDIPKEEPTISVTMTSTNQPEPLTPETTETQPESSFISETPAAEESGIQWDAIKEQIVSILSDFPEFVGKFYQEYKQPITVIGLIVATVITLKVVLGLVDVINDIPLLSPSFQLIGVAYSAWFIYRYLLRATTRQELSQNVQNLISEILGKKS